MAVLTRIVSGGFVPNTLIKSQEVNDELNQLVNLLSGVSTDKDTLLKYNHATDPVLRVDQLGAGLIQRWLHNGTSRATLSALGKFVLPAGIGATPSADTISNFGLYAVDFTTRGNAAGSGDTTLFSKTVAANTFGSDGDVLIYFSWFNVAGNANSKRLRGTFGGQVFYDSAASVNLNGNPFLAVGAIIRSSSTTFRGAAMTFNINADKPAGVNVLFFSNGTGFNYAGANNLDWVGNGVAANDIDQLAAVYLKGSV